MKKVIQKNGNLIFQIDGKEVLPAAYMTYCPEQADYKGFADIGYRLFSYCIYAGNIAINEENGLLRSWEPGCWISENEFDFTPLDKGMERITNSCTEEVYVILRININMPEWWREKYTDELIHYSTGNILMQSVCSLQWRKDACVYLRKLKEHIDASRYNKSIIAWQIAAMQTEEWIHPTKYRMNLEKELPLLHYFRNWCRKKYNDIQCLNSVWGSEYNSFDLITLPGAEQLVEKDSHGSVTPAGLYVKDFTTCLNAAYGETISFFTRFIKDIHNWDILCGAFTGYIGQLQDFQGHSIMNQLLDEKSIDFFASPFAYVNQRGSAVDWIYHAPMQTVTNEGKLWFIESDVRTCLTKHLSETRPDVCSKDLPYFNQPVFFGPSTIEQSKANILRSFSKFFISQHAFWWFDMWGGWYRNAEFMTMHRKLYELYKEKVCSPVKNTTEIAVVLDENASYKISADVFYHSIYSQLIELGYLGAPYDLLLMDKVRREDTDKYKLFIFLSPDHSSKVYTGLINQIGERGKAVLVTGDCPESKGRLYDRDFLKEQAEKVGVFLYSFGNIVYANEKYISVTAVKDGEVCLCTPCDGTLEDVIDGSILETEDKKVFWNTESNICRLFSKRIQ